MPNQLLLFAKTIIAYEKAESSLGLQALKPYSAGKYDDH